MYNISIIGSGNLATRLSVALAQSGQNVVAICDRTLEKAEHLAGVLKRYRAKAVATDDYRALPQSDIIIIAVSDNAIAEVAANFTNSSSLILHTSGATDIATLKDCGIKRYGVLYPIMTLSKSKNIDIKIVPFLIEAGSDNEIKLIVDIVNSFKAEYKICDSKRRLEMHVAAVYVSNFVNYMLTLAYDIAYPDYVHLLPLAIESVRKGFLIKPEAAQTGPARRADTKTIERHISLLEERFPKSHLEVYRLLTELIKEKYNK